MRRQRGAGAGAWHPPQQHEVHVPAYRTGAECVREERRASLSSASLAKPALTLHFFLGDVPQGDGCVIVKTKQAVLVAEYVQPTQAPEATPIVEGLADYLISVGY